MANYCRVYYFNSIVSSQRLNEVNLWYKKTKQICNICKRYISKCRTRSLCFAKLMFDLRDEHRKSSLRWYVVHSIRKIILLIIIITIKTKELAQLLSIQKTFLDHHKHTLRISEIWTHQIPSSGGCLRHLRSTTLQGKKFKRYPKETI